MLPTEILRLSPFERAVLFETYQRGVKAEAERKRRLAAKFRKAMSWPDPAWFGED